MWHSSVLFDGLELEWVVATELHLVDSIIHFLIKLRLL